MVMIILAAFYFILDSVSETNNSEGVQERKKCHPSGRPSIFDCTESKELVGQHCTLNDHKDNKCELMENISMCDMISLYQDMDSLIVLKDKLTKAKEKIDKTVLDIEANNESIINNLHTTFKKLHNILEQREQELVDDATTTARQKLHNLSQQGTALALASAELQSVLDYTKHFNEKYSFRSMNTDLRKMMQQKIQEHSESGQSLEPVDEADIEMEVTCDEVFLQLCLTQANITTAVDPAKCTVNLTAPAEVGKPYVGTLTARLSNGKPNNRKCKITCQLKSLYNRVTTDCAIDKDGPGRYSIKYTPTIRGPHELIVLINGHHVEGSPFPVYVSIHPTQLGKPVGTVTELTRPCGITANSKGEIVVALFDNPTNIVKYDTEGNRVDLIKKSGLVNPYGIACDDEDKIYCIDKSSNKILTCEGNGDFQLHEVKLDKDSSGRTALAITDKKLFMAENNHPGVIKVYNKQLQHLSTINHRNMKAKDISVDVHQNLYVSDFNNSSVHVFTKDGVYLRSIGHDKKELKKPWGVCVRGQYVYVTDVSHCVFVFTTDGEYVTSFGQNSQKKGPHFVHVDSYGFICITDKLNSTIQYF